MALGELRFPQGIQHRFPMLEKPQLVGHGALALSQEPCRLLLAHAPLIQQPPDADGLLHEIKILPLQILHQRREARFLLIHAHEDAGNVRHPG